MSEVPKGRRNHSKLEAQTLASDIRGQITTEIMVTFGYSQKKYEDHIKAMTGYIQNPEEREAVAETIRKRYTDDSYIIHRSKEKLLQAFEGIKKIAAEFGLIINERKTRICKLSDTYRHLQIQYSLTASGRLIRKINPKAVTRERRRLKAYKRLLDAGRMAYSKIEESFKSWIASVYKYMSRQQIQGLSRLFYDLFGKAPTWKKTHGSSHGRLRWMMALPSAA